MVRPVTCPICGKPVSPTIDPANTAAPFCSDRCKKIDFFRWTDGRYAIVEPLAPEQIAEQMLKEQGIDPEDAE